MTLPRASLLISTYNWPSALEKVFWSLFAQSRRDFEVVIADDGSGPETAELVARMAARCPVPVIHVWQPDTGFAKCRILNKALALARADRIIVTDGDCVLRQDFVDTHIRRARRGRFLSGGYFKLSAATSEAISEDGVTSGAVFRPRWLMGHGVPFGPRLFKVASPPMLARLLDGLSKARPTWNGNNASCQRADALAVNGFNEDMGYGGLDVEFGLRLNHIGITVERIRFATAALHLHHARGYATPEARAASALIKEHTRAARLNWAVRGVDQWIGPDGTARLPPDDQVRYYPAALL